jgi:nicotinamide-nucleotide adenylyltransferase
MKTGLYIGRFQPFHLGHLSAVRQAMTQVGRLIIGIGSSAENHEPENPFTLQERIKMITLALKEVEIPEKNFTIIPIPDINDDAKWPGYVKSLAPRFDVIFTNSDIVRKLFEKYENGTTIKPINFELNISGTSVRRKMNTNADWQSDMPPSVAAYLEKIKAPERIKEINR